MASPAKNIAVFIKEMVKRQDGRKLKQSKPGLPKRFKVAYAHLEFAQTALKSKNDWMISEGTCSFETGTSSWLENKKKKPRTFEEDQHLNNKLMTNEELLKSRPYFAYAHRKFVETALQNTNDWMILKGTCTFETGTLSSQL